MPVHEVERFPVAESNRLLFQDAAYVADPCTKRIIDTYGSTIAFSDLDLIRQGLAKLRGERPMNAPRLPAQHIEIEEAPALIDEIEAVASEIRDIS